MAGHRNGRHKMPDEYPGICPACGRPVRPPRAPKELYPGTLAAIRADGTCSSCIYKEVQAGKRPERRQAGPDTRHYEPPEPNPIREAYNLAGYISWRKRREARGVPDEGHHVATLCKPGLFSWEIK